MVRDGTPTRPSGSLDLRVGDRVLLLAEADDLEALTRLFTLEGELARASVLRARVRTDVDLASIPLFGAIGTVEVSGDAAAPVDRYRSLLAEPSP